MIRVYKCLSQQEFTHESCKLVPIRDEDKYTIMQWRNEQIDILRQKEPLTQEKQEKYFEDVVAKLFEQQQPDQLLFSFLENDALIGYGGLVHIDWNSRNAEISFIINTKLEKSFFYPYWTNYLALIEKIAFDMLKFHKIFTYAFDIRPHLYEVLEKAKYKKEAQLKEHYIFNNKLIDVLIHSKINQSLIFRSATHEDTTLYFEWVNDKIVRENSFIQDKIEWEEHKKWFIKKLSDAKCLMLVATLEKKIIGQIRFDEVTNGTYEIDFSIEKASRGKGFGEGVVKLGTTELFKKNPFAKRVIGKVKKQNLASIKSFIYADFKQLTTTGQNEEIAIYYFDNPS